MKLLPYALKSELFEVGIVKIGKRIIGRRINKNAVTHANLLDLPVTFLRCFAPVQEQILFAQ